MSKTTVYDLSVPMKVDFVLLCKQKRELTDLIAARGECNDLLGLLGLLDAIQDYAVRHGGVSEKEVYGDSHR